MEPLLDSGNAAHRQWSRDILANYFRNLWTSAECFDILERIIRDHSTGGCWPDIWRSIKQTIHFCREDYNPVLHSRLEALERLTAPFDLYSEIEAYALANTWDHIEVKVGNFTENIQELHEKVVRLGKLTAAKPDYLKKLAPRLWEKSIDALDSFGKGLALGATDERSTFEFLIRLMQEQEPKFVHPNIFKGFIAGVHSRNPDLARQLQERVYEVPELKRHFVLLLCATPITLWSVKTLIDCAKTGKLEAFQFEQIGYGRKHESIPDRDLSELLAALNGMTEGIFSTLEILGMRFIPDNTKEYIPSESVLSVGRQAILKLPSMHNDEISKHQLHGYDQVLEKCLADSAPVHEINRVVEELCRGIASYRLYSFQLENIIDTLTTNFPELIFDRVFRNDQFHDMLEHLFFHDGIDRRVSPINLISVEHMVKWCDGNQDRILKLASAVSPLHLYG